jgi:glycosyltransferase involved in cell wall biosynthesis
MAVSIVVCIPLYDGAPFIPTALESVLEQSRAPEEIIVVDDGSTDDGPEIVADYARRDSRIRLLTKPNGGQSSARNLGVSQSTATHIAFLDQDDWWYPRHLEALERAASGYTGAGRVGWIYSDLDEYDGSGRLYVRRLLQTMGTEHPKRTIHSCLAQNMYVLPSASLITRDAFEAVQGFDERLSGYEDDDLFLRMFISGFSNVFVPEGLGGWRIHGDSTSRSARMTDSAIVYADKLFGMFPNDVATRRYFCRDLIAPRFLREALGSYSLAAETGNRAMMQSALKLLDLVLPRLSMRRRASLRAVRPLLDLGLVQRWSGIRELRETAMGAVRSVRL